MSEELNALKEAIEAKMGQKLLSNKDFISLARPNQFYHLEAHLGLPP